MDDAVGGHVVRGGDAHAVGGGELLGLGVEVDPDGGVVGTGGGHHVLVTEGRRPPRLCQHVTQQHGLQLVLQLVRQGARHHQGPGLVLQREAGGRGEREGSVLRSEDGEGAPGQLLVQTHGADGGQEVVDAQLAGRGQQVGQPQSWDRGHWLQAHVRHRLPR